MLFPGESLTSGRETTNPLQLAANTTESTGSAGISSFVGIWLEFARNRRKHAFVMDREQSAGIFGNPSSLTYAYKFHRSLTHMITDLALQ